MAGGKRPLPPGQKTLSSFFTGKKSKPTAAARSTEPAAPSGPTIPPTADAEPPGSGLAVGANGSAAASGPYFDGDTHVAPNYSDDDADSSDDDDDESSSVRVASGTTRAAPRRRSRPDTGTTTAPSDTVSI